MKNTLKKISCTTKKSQASYKRIKRSIDIIGSLGFIIFFSPLYIIVALIIFFDSGFPIFFRQKRTGLSGQSFIIYKFRTMGIQQGNDSIFNWNEGIPDDFVFKSASSHQYAYTRTGRFLRKWSLDELPQFFNVLNGSMSIVGPRPEIPEITQHYTPFMQQRLQVRPGITGLAQINGRSNLTHDEKINYDLHYCKQHSIGLDIKIMLLTLYKIFSRQGAI